ncbi:HRDC domain-containing protein [bacterium]|nr:HRDC domain-containing protein [bacterium]
MAFDYVLIDTNEQMLQLLDAVSGDDSVGIDTEADSLHHYREKLCLIQICAGGQQWIIDPLVGGLTMAPLMDLLAGRELVLHGADYDLRLLWRTYGFRPSRIFDTMIAAQLLGWPQYGLAASVQRVVGIELSKHGQRADWSRRPLTEKLLCYAACDTRYLRPLIERQREELTRLGRLDWHRDSCRRVMAGACSEQTADQREAWRLKGGRHLRGRAAAIMRELWRWREDTARRLDRPPFKILGSEYILEWATYVADHPDATVQDGPEPPRGLHEGRLASFQRALEKALNMPPGLWPGEPHLDQCRRCRRVPEDLLRRVLTVRDGLARELGIEPGILASREALNHLLLKHIEGYSNERRPEGPGLMKWQHDLLAPHLAPIFEEQFQELPPAPDQ